LDDDLRLPAIAISGGTSPDELRRVAEAGYRMLHKPVSTATRYAALDQEVATIVAG